jgi:HlyD family secretion protein
MTGRAAGRARGRAGRTRRAVRGVFAAGCVAAAACSDAAYGVRGSGTVEMDEVDVASMVGGRVVRLYVDEGDTVRAGDTLAVLERPEVEAEVRAQAAQWERATAVWRDLAAGPRAQEIEAAAAESAAAAAELRYAEAELRRIRALFEERLVSEQDVERAQSAHDAARARQDAAAKRLALLRAGYRELEVRAAREAAEAARAQYEAAAERARELVLTAPVDGVVLLRTVEPGELVGPGVPVVTLGDPRRLWLSAYVPATEIGRVRLGAPATVTVTGLPGRTFRGRVVEIATRAEFTPRAALTEEERANLVFRVKIALEPAGGALKPGLPADAVIEAATPEG